MHPVSLIFDSGTEAREAGTMEFFLEILLTALLSLLFSFLLAKLISMASVGDVDEQESVLRSGKEIDAGVVTEERDFKGELKKRGLESDERVEFVGEALKVGEFEAELVQEKLERVRGVEEFMKDGGGPPVEFGEDDRIGEEEGTLKEESKVLVLKEEKLVKERSDKEEVKVGDSDLGEVEIENISTKDDLFEDNLVEEGPERVEDCEINVELAKDEQIVAKDERARASGCESYQEKETEGREQRGGNDDEAEGLFSNDDDWEGIERSELEKLFATASEFVGSGENNDLLSKVGSDVQMQLYALHKVATEGPCHDPQPMALRVSARAKWNAWQGLGSMSPEVAMEQYISLLLDSVPGWMGEKLGRYSIQGSLDTGISRSEAPDSRTFPHHQPGFENERKQGELQSSVKGGDAIGDPNYVKRDKL